MPAQPPLLHGDCVFDPDHPWDRVRGGIVTEREGVLRMWVPRVTAEEFRAGDPYEVRLVEYPGRLELNVLLGNVERRPLAIDPAPYYAIRSAALNILRDTEGRRLPLNQLLQRLGERPDLAQDLIERTLRMMIANGDTDAANSRAQGILYSLSDRMAGMFARIDYLATFADELLIKSRRVDLLIQHTGTVGSYREEMLRALLRQIVPRKYEVSTGFIEHCPRQLDILIWDASGYVPLFREGDVVVVPRSAVRAVIEVKTTLNTTALDEAMHILWDAFRVNLTAAPVFKGIFGYEPGYASDANLADRMKAFYRSVEPDGIIKHEHWYLFAGINMVCVPRSLFVRENYVVPDDPVVFPQPHLSTITSDWPGDSKTALFLGGLLSHLDMDAVPKSDAIRLFDPLLSTMAATDLGAIYEEPWTPRLSLSGMEAMRYPDGARTYLQRVQAFRQGEIVAADIPAGLAREEGNPEAPDQPAEGAEAPPPEGEA
ncbi:hypothetical protein ASG51_14465 [Methylobacterium sp. Leaf465]|nr:hypothetical protein ASG51_14465 [Methylobacterium sp. Leaf465]